METVNKFSLWGDSFTDVRYNIGPYKLKFFSVVLIDIIVYFELVYC